MGEVASAYVSLLPTAKGFGAATSKALGGELDKAGRAGGERFAGGMKTRLGGLAKGVVAPLTGALAAIGVGNFLKGSFAEARESQKVGALTAQVIKTTGGAARVTAKDVGRLATAISNKTGIDDEAIQSGSNLLLTFTNIRNEVGKGNDIFNQATQTVTDMSAALGQDTKSSAIQLGKALNDPIKGVTALSRVGVSFTEQQKDQIKTLVTSGDTLSAQKIVLGELNREFGGSAAASATAGEKMSTAFANFKESIGTALLPALDGVERFITLKMLPALSAVVGFLSGPQVGRAFHLVTSAVKGFFGALSGADAGQAVDDVRSKLSPLIGAVKGFVSAVISAGRQAGPALVSIGKALAPFARAAIVAAIGLLVGAFRLLAPVVRAAGAALNVAGNFAKHHATTFRIIAAVIAGIFVPALIAWGVQSVIAGAKAVGAWIASNAAAVAGAAAQSLAAARVVASWVLMGAQSLLAAARVAAAWLIALGPAALIVAAVAGVVVLVIKYWDQIKSATIAVWNFIKKHLKTILEAIFVAITGPIGLVVVFLVRHWDKVKQGVRSAWNAIKSVVSTAVDAIVGFIKALPGRILGFLSSLGAKLWHLITAAFGMFARAEREGITRVLALVKALPRQIISALGDVGHMLYDAGKKIIQGLIDGIKSMGGAVKGAVGGVLHKARGLLPFSPAKEGPFSGKGWTLYSGQAIGDALAEGLLSRTGRVGAAAFDLASAAVPTISLPRAPGFDGATAVAAPTAGGFSLVVNNPVPEPASVSVPRALREHAFLAGSAW